MNKELIRNNFSRNAATYDLYSSVQRLCGVKLAALLPEGTPGSILEIGCGTGAFTALLSGKYPAARITAVDISGKMIDIARSGLVGKNVEFIEADIEKAEISGSFDLITSNASLHWLEDVSGAISRFASLLSDNGTLCFSIYGPRTFWELNEILSASFGRKQWLQSRQFPKFEELRDGISAYLSEVDVKEEFYIEECPSMLELMKAVRCTGTRGEGLSERLFLGKERIKKLEKDFNHTFKTIKTTHHVYFCKGKKAL